LKTAALRAKFSGVPGQENAAVEGRAQLLARYPAITGCRITLEPIDGSAWNARVEVLLPQHQLIVNAAGADQAGARRSALARAAETLEQVVKRDPRLR
jgi:hypothetical protein